MPRKPPVHLLEGSIIAAGPMLREFYNGKEDVYRVRCGKKVSLSQEPERFTILGIPTCKQCTLLLRGTHVLHRRLKSPKRLPS